MNFKKFIPVSVILAVILIGTTVPKLFNLSIKVLETLIYWIQLSVWHFTSVVLFVICVGYLLFVALYLAKFEIERNEKDIERKEDSNL
jgi:Ca2+/Na+ antiporter